jgi:hypothetical protein
MIFLRSTGNAETVGSEKRKSDLLRLPLVTIQTGRTRRERKGKVKEKSAILQLANPRFTDGGRRRS